MDKSSLNNNFTFNNLVNLEKHLESLIHNLHDLSIIINNFEDPKTNQTVFNKIKDIINNYKFLYTNKVFTSETIPQDIIDYIEDGRNPDVYTRQFSELVQKDNQYVNGKSIAVTNFRNILAQDIKNNFPNMINEVEKILKNTNKN
ncbi:unnamed protein product [Pneumocystis jirovecii]|uniref:Mediator of RNA polymerase II transcription subunit 10 n=2 Tax=Pneumocystis jirovecii TaxID=42068 RepID=L0P937_PNEJI|nr:mediator complex subunit NUT2 [Pneumocystis jirovecii RU7]KTW32773.1 hypothetical protein T551_00258 [Pneumocystis jirovecii RU7]CCJ28891.1 unnamed protein product [Pneumocystis jirovecii]